MPISAEQSRLAMIREATYGVTPATPVFDLVRFRSEGVAPQANITQSGELTQSRGVADSIQSGYSVAGTIEGELARSDGFDRIIEGVMGRAWGDLVADQVTPGFVRFGHTIEKTFDTAGTPYFHRYTGVTFSQISISAQPNQPITFSTGVVSGNLALDSAIIAGATYYGPSPAIEDAPVMSSPQMSVAFGGTLSGVATCATALEITLNSQNRETECLGVSGPDDAVLGQLEVKGTISLHFKDNAAMQYFLDADKGGTILVTFNDRYSTPNVYSLFLPRVAFNQNTANIRGTATDIIYETEFESLETGASPSVLMTRTQSAPSVP
jgi:hypothetical protein